MKITLLMLTTLALALGACRSGPFTPGKSGERIMVFAVSGGIAGILEEWRFVSNGQVEILANGRRRQARVRPQEFDRTFQAILQAGFFDLEEVYRPDPVWNDAFVYRLTVTQGIRTKTVVAEQGAVLPPGLITSFSAMSALTQLVPPAP